MLSRMAEEFSRSKSGPTAAPYNSLKCYTDHWSAIRVRKGTDYIPEGKGEIGTGIELSFPNPDTDTDNNLNMN